MTEYAYNYSYPRSTITLADGTMAWDTDNPNRVDGEGNQIHLAKEIEAEFPNWKFVCTGDNSTLLVRSNQVCPNPVALRQVVEDHQNNV